MLVAARANLSDEDIAMRTLKKQQLLDICYGAAFLESGDIGSFKTALRLIENLPDNLTGKVKTMEMDDAVKSVNSEQ